MTGARESGIIREGFSQPSTSRRQGRGGRPGKQRICPAKRRLSWIGERRWCWTAAVGMLDGRAVTRLAGWRAGAFREEKVPGTSTCRDLRWLWAVALLCLSPHLTSPFPLLLDKYSTQSGRFPPSIRSPSRAFLRSALSFSVQTR